MNDDSVPATEIVEEHGSFLLIRAGSRFAVVERRGGQIYPMMPGKREGEPLTSEGMASVIAQEGSLPEDEARRLFAELCARGDRLAQTDVVAEPLAGRFRTRLLRVARNDGVGLVIARSTATRQSRCHGLHQESSADPNR